MKSIEKLKFVHALCVNLVEETSIYDTRLPAIIGVRNGIADAVTELELCEE